MTNVSKNKNKKFDLFWPCCCGLRHYDETKDIYLYDKFS